MRVLFLRCSALLLVTLGLVAIAQDKPMGPTPSLVYKGHTEAIYSVVTNSDGKLIATGSFDKSVRLWDAATGKLVREFAGEGGHKSLVLSVAFNPTGDQVASGGSDNVARIWDVPLSTPIKDLPHPAAVTAVTVSADGKLLATAVNDGSVKLWNVADGKPLATIAAGHTGGATGVAFSANGQLLATSGADGALRFWNPADGKPLGAIGAHAGSISNVLLSAGGNSAYSVGADGLLKQWLLPIPATKPLPTHTDAITVLATSSDGETVYTGGADKVVKVGNSNSGQLQRELTGATAAITCLAPIAGNQVVAAGTSDGKVMLWNAADGKLIGQLPAHVGGVAGISAGPNGTGFITVGADGALRSWTYPLVASRSMAHPDRILGTGLTSDAKRLVTGGADKLARIWSLSTGTMERQFTGHTAAVHAGGFTADGSVLITASADETIRFWNATNGTQTAVLAGHVGPIHTLAVAPTSQFVATGGEDGTVKIWALPVTPMKAFAHPDAVLSFVVSVDGNRVLTVGNDKQVRLWNLNAANPERAYTAGPNIAATALAPDGTTVAIATTDKNISIRSGDKEIKKIPVPNEVRSLAFTTNNAGLVVAGADGSLRLFNMGDSKELKNVAAHAGGATFVMASPKGDIFYSVGADKTLRSWAVADLAAKGKIDLPMVPTSISISKDVTKIAIAADKAVALFTLADGKAAGTMVAPADVKGLALSGDGLRVATAGADNKVRLYGPDLKLQEVFLHEGASTGVSFHPDGKRIISTSADKSLRLWAPSLVAQGGHTGPVRQVLITPTADRVISVGDDKQVRIWDAKTAKELKAIPAGDGPIVGVSISTDVSKLATASADKTARVWNVADGKQLVSVPLPGAAQACALSPNGQRLAVAFVEGVAHKLRVYDVTTGRELQSLPDAAAAIRSLTFLADNRSLIVTGDDKTIAVHDVAVTSMIPVHVGGAVAVAVHPSAAQALTVGKDKVVKLWDLTAAKESKAFPALADNAVCLAASRDYAVFAVGAGKTTKVVQISDGKELASLVHPADVVSVGFSNDRARLITGSVDNIARVWEVATGRLLQTFAHTGPVRGVAIHPNRPVVVTASADKTAIVHPYLVTRVGPVSTMPIRAFAFAPNGASILAVGDDKLARSINASNGAEERKYEGSEGALYAVAVSRNGQYVATGGADKIVRIYTINDAKLVGSVTMGAAVRGLSFAPPTQAAPNTLLLVGVGDDKSVTAWNVTNQVGQPLPDDFGKVVQQFTHTEAALGVSIGEKGELFTGSADKSAKQWKIPSPVPTRNFQHPNLVDAVAWSPDGKQLATACHDGVLRIHDVEKNTVLKAINAHTQPQPSAIYSVVWSPDGKQVLSTSFDKSMKLWDVASGNMIREFKGYTEKTFEKGHGDQVFCAAFTKDGKFIFSGSSDRKIKMWNVADGNVLREFAHPTIKGEPGQSHPGGVYGLKLSADEKFLYSAGPAPRNTGYVAVWNVADGKFINGTPTDFGPIFSLALTPDGKSLLLGCGPKIRQVPEANAVVIPVLK